MFRRVEGLREERQRVEEESEDEYLLGEIRRFLSPEPVHASDTLLSETPRTHRPQAVTPSPKICELNQFIQKKRMKYEAKSSVMAERRYLQQMERITPSVEVQQRARKLAQQRERYLKDIRLKRLLAHKHEDEREDQRFYHAMKHEARDVQTKAAIERIYRGSKAHKQLMT
jgi:hypothetical protein